MSDEQEPSTGQESVRVYASLRRRPIRRKHVYHRPNSKRLLLIVFILILLGAGAAGFAYYRATKYYYAIMLDDMMLTVLDTREQAVQVLRQVQLHYSPKVPEVITYTQGEPTIVARKHLRPVDIGKATELLEQQLTPMQRGYAIFLNGTPVIMLGSKELAAEAISRALQVGMGNQDGIPTFQDRVSIALLRRVKGEHDFIPAMTPEEAANELTHPPRKRYYTVKNGDNFWSIANANGLLISDLDVLNPQFKKDHLLHKDDIIRLPDELAPLHVVVRKP